MAKGKLAVLLNNHLIFLSVISNLLLNYILATILSEVL